MWDVRYEKVSSVIRIWIIVCDDLRKFMENLNRSLSDYYYNKLEPSEIL